MWYGGLAVRRAAAWYYVHGVKEDAGIFLPDYNSEGLLRKLVPYTVPSK
jgi:hypothetical protein